MFILKGIPLLVAKISNNRLVPNGFENREIWHKPAGGFVPLWMRKLARGDNKFWLPEDDVPTTPSTHKQETFSGSSHEKTAENVRPASLHTLPPAEVVHQTAEVPHNEQYGV